MKVAAICATIERWAPRGLAYSWDRVGLQLGAPSADVDTVLTCLSVDDTAVRAAIDAHAQLIVAHHPLIWEPLTALRTDRPQVRRILALAAAGIACYVAHTNLDVVPGGVSDGLAQRLALEKRRPLLPIDQARAVKLIIFVPATHLAALRDAVSQAGAGVIGDYTHCSFSTPGTGTFRPGAGAQPYSGEVCELSEEPERRFETLVPKARLEPVLEAARAAHPYEEMAYDVVGLENGDSAYGLGYRGELATPMALDEFAAHLCRALNVTHVQTAGAPRSTVHHIAVLGGSGGGQIGALPPGIDAYVTGDVKYHEAQLAADRGIAVIDAGHHGTEQHVPVLLADYLRSECPDIQVIAHAEAAPFRVHVP